MNKIKDLNFKIKILEEKKNSNIYENYSDELIKLSLYIPKSEDNSKIINRLKSFCETLSLTLYSVDFSSPYEIKNYSKSDNINVMNLYAIPVDVEIKGSYENLCNFIKCCEEDERICQIKSLDIKRNEQSYIAHLQILYYYLKSVEVEEDFGSDNLVNN
ncbi:type 4a pilus biogenesis protein PilO [Caloramator sp. E03]|uniref:type 4a pilus biogenesis protein PilO n=1 Tax=Caloramator sp. E03 TaxID=2576307 RepID=UPI00143DABD4|nr:type 4a pilus biogenesis protein PilO [Caloramator sp. E03]